MRAILGTDLPFEVVSQKLDLPELQARVYVRMCACVYMYMYVYVARQMEGGSIEPIN